MVEVVLGGPMEDIMITQGTARAQSYVWIVQTREYGWAKSNRDKQYWATTNDCYLQRDQARRRAKELRNSGEEVRVVKFVVGE